MDLISFRKLSVKVTLFGMMVALTVPSEAISRITVIEPLCFLMAAFLL